MINHYFMDIKNGHTGQLRTMLPTPSPSPSTYQQNLKQSYESGVLDLSRRRDSVETRKTPSPYQSSSFGEGSPIRMHYSPTTTTSSSMQNTHSHSPIHQFSSPATPHPYVTEGSTNSQHSPPAYPPTSYLCHPKIEPDHELELHTRLSDPNCDEQFHPYMLQAAALQHQMATQSVSTRDLSDESSDNSSHNMVSSNTSNQFPIMVMGRDGKLARPFKAYPRDPLSITASFTAADALLDNRSTEKYNLFRKRMLAQIHKANGGQPTISNPKMRRTSSKMIESASSTMMNECKQHLADEMNEDANNNNSDSGCSLKDSAYFERRKKNNAAAKKSRDRRRIKEDEIAIRAAYLERENIELKYELTSLKNQLTLYGVPAGK